MCNESKMTAVLLNASQLDFDGRLTFKPLQTVVDVVRYEATNSDQVVERAQGCGILISKELPLRKDVIEDLPDEVRLICEAGTGIDNIDLSETEKKNILVCNVPDYSTSSVAQLTQAFILALSTGMHQLIRSAPAHDLENYRGHEVQSKILGVIGAGAIGQRVIHHAREFGMSVVVCNPSLRSWADKDIRQVELEELLEKSHFVSLHCPYKTDTVPLIRAETISRMRPGANLINTSRGRLVNHDDLAEAIQSGRLAGAGLDVQHPEPLPNDHVLWSLPNVIITAHIGWKTIEARERLVNKLSENIAAYLRGTPENVVKPT